MHMSFCSEKISSLMMPEGDFIAAYLYGVCLLPAEPIELRAITAAAVSLTINEPHHITSESSLSISTRQRSSNTLLVRYLDKHLD